MEKRLAFLVGVLLLQLVIHCSGADLKGEEGAKTVVDPKVPLTSNGSKSSDDKKVVKNLVSDDNEVQEVKKDKDQDSGLKDGVRNSKEKSGSDGELGSTESHSVPKDEKGSNYAKSGKPGEESKAKPKEKVGNAGNVNPVREDGTPREGCGSANMCTVEENMLVACLRVPGDDDSPHLSLLIQNKGKDPLVVTISAPEFVLLEKSKVQLKEKANAKVDVSVGNGGGASILVLKAENGNCSLDFKDLIHHGSRKEPDNSSSTAYFYIWTHRPAIGILLIASLMILIFAGMYIRFMKRRVSSGGFKYQKLDDAHLPVLSSEKPESHINDGWDDTWDDNWDDEEAPHTPSMPVTPSLSGKGLASRRLNKEGWKD
ncbi:uncharacterized protein LOC126794802 [Argentina anserina]|uniref:uncharacterized protein LOC126794802 n=1 Tax=Argentina anserina TaxID=57926 RepID=UPI002176894C|nr:uncharacterized protein LOC126794802 [Potentilla anserina]